MQVTHSRLEASLLKYWPESRQMLSALSLPVTCRLEVDSRRLTRGDVFVAVPGVAADGRHFIDDALAVGASLVLAHQYAQQRHADPRVLWLSGLKEALGPLARECFAVPGDLEVIGVTGTNGKTSVTHHLAALSEALGVSTGLIGTLGQGRVGKLHDTGLTTPGPVALQAALGELAAAKMTRVAMEVSSHALEQGRLDGCRISVGVFTNLTRDHLDYHGSLAGYAAAKARLFQRPELELAVVNGDDPLARLMLAGLAPGVRVLAIGEQEATTLRVVDWVPHVRGQRALIATPEGERVIELGLMGRFTLNNVLLSIAILYGLGHSLEELFTAASDLAPVPGRMEALVQPGCPTVVIDYAHTPDALNNALTALRAHLPGKGRLWCVFGCGGDRDTGKRALMAAAAECQADVIVVTDDNPRSEDPASIREQILSGLSHEARERAWNMDDRRRAFARVLTEASTDDVVLIAGKGHETYQEIAGVRHDFSDRVEAEKRLSERTRRMRR